MKISNIATACALISIASGAIFQNSVESCIGIGFIGVSMVCTVVEDGFGKLLDFFEELYYPVELDEANEKETNHDL